MQLAEGVPAVSAPLAFGCTLEKFEGGYFMKRMLCIVLTLVMVLSMTACGGGGGGTTENYPTPENPITIKWGLSVSTANQAYLNAQVVADHVMEATDGAIVIELCPNSQLGNESAMWEGILSGTIDMANITTSTLATTIPEFEAFTLPFVFHNAETFWNVVSKDEFREHFTETIAERGAVLVGISSMFTRGIATNQPITLPSDLKDNGLKLHIMSGHTYADMFASWGAGTISLPFNEVYTALQQGVIDGLCVDIGGAVDQRFFEEAPYFLNTYHSFHCSPGVMRAGLWNSLSPEQQQAFVDGYQMVADNAVEIYYADREASTARGEEIGAVFTYLTPEQRQIWIDEVAWMYEDYEYLDSEFQTWFMDFIEQNRVESDRY